jgi:hypothetical protein
VSTIHCVLLALAFLGSESSNGNGNTCAVVGAGGAIQCCILDDEPAGSGPCLGCLKYSGTTCVQTVSVPACNCPSGRACEMSGALECDGCALPPALAECQ